MKTATGDLPAGDPQIRKRILEDLELGNVEHIIGISAHPVYVTTDVTKVPRQPRRHIPLYPETQSD